MLTKKDREMTTNSLAYNFSYSFNQSLKKALDDLRLANDLLDSVRGEEIHVIDEFIKEASKSMEELRQQVGKLQHNLSNTAQEAVDRLADAYTYYRENLPKDPRGRHNFLVSVARRFSIKGSYYA